MMVVRCCTNERLLARSQAEGARRRRPRRPEEGGGEDLLGLDAHYREVSKTQEANRRGGPEALARTNALHLRYLRGAPRPMEATRRERRSDARAPLRTVGGVRRREGVGGHHEPGRAQARLDVQKKSLGASEQNEQARGAWREYVRALGARSEEAGVRGRMLHQHRPHEALRQGPERRAGLREGAQELGQERNPHLLFGRRRHRGGDERRGGNRRGRLRGLRGALPGPEAEAGTDRGDGQPPRPQDEEG